jgi:hypothetical protein
MLIRIKLRAICISNRREHCKSFYYNGNNTHQYETCLCPFLFIFLLRSIDPMIADNCICDCSRLSQAPCLGILFCSSFMMLFHLHNSCPNMNNCPDGILLVHEIHEKNFFATLRILFHDTSTESFYKEGPCHIYSACM